MSSDLNRFPFPLEEDSFRYTNNSVPLEPPVCVDVTAEYKEEIKLKRLLLEQHPERCYRSLPHTYEAQREVVDLLTNELSREYPQFFTMERTKNKTLFQNRLTNDFESFNRSHPQEPLNQIGRHVQEDLLLLTQRDGELYLDAGQLCFPSNWSLAFNIGMAFKIIHDPVPGLSRSRLLEKIRKFIMRIEPGKPWTRKNWSLTVDHQLNTPLETLTSWGKKRKEITSENAGDRIHLRVEVQKLFRLPATNSILFSIHTHLLPIRRLRENPEWLRRFQSVLHDIPSNVATYKGMGTYKKALLQYLETAFQA